jgi:hypothetical protein
MNLVATDFEQNVLVPEESHSALRQADTGDWPERTGGKVEWGGGGGGGVSRGSGGTGAYLMRASSGFRKPDRDGQGQQRERETSSAICAASIHLVDCLC